MRGIISITLIVIGVAQSLYFGHNIISLFFLLLLGFLGGIIAGVSQTRSQRDSENLNTLATIERNRYFRKHE